MQTPRIGPGAAQRGAGIPSQSRDVVTRCQAARFLPGRKDPAVRKDLERMRDEITRNISPDELAVVAGIGKYQFVRRLRPRTVFRRTHIRWRCGLASHGGSSNAPAGHQRGRPCRFRRPESPQPPLPAASRHDARTIRQCRLAQPGNGRHRGCGGWMRQVRDRAAGRTWHVAFVVADLCRPSTIMTLWAR